MLTSSLHYISNYRHYIELQQKLGAENCYAVLLIERKKENLSHFKRATSRSQHATKSAGKYE